VPSASLVPCLRSLPAGWTLSNVTVNNGRSVLTLDNDRAGMGAMVVRLAATCDPAGASPVLSDQPGVRRLMLIQDLAPMFSATRFDVFAGGCVSTRMTAPVTSRAEITSEASPSSATPPASRSSRRWRNARADGYTWTQGRHNDHHDDRQHGKSTRQGWS